MQKKLWYIFFATFSIFCTENTEYDEVLNFECIHLHGDHLDACMDDLGPNEFKKNLLYLNTTQYQRLNYLKRKLKKAHDFKQLASLFSDEEWKIFWNAMPRGEQQLFKDGYLHANTIQNLQALIEKKENAEFRTKMYYIGGITLIVVGGILIYGGTLSPAISNYIEGKTLSLVYDSCAIAGNNLNQEFQNK